MSNPVVLDSGPLGLVTNPKGGEVAATAIAGKDSHGRGMIINSSRGIIFASQGPDFAQAARKATENLRAKINQYR